MKYQIVVKGRPVSYNSSTRSKNTWKAKVAAAASLVFNTPLNDPDLRVRITIFYDGIWTYDANNATKPICDALCGIGYIDDSQVIDPYTRMRDLNRSFRIKGIPPEVAVALSEGEEFVWITISKVGNEVEILE
jgi:Holliday junction resolvase RusA-like endonuclease